MRWSIEPGRFALLGFSEPPSSSDLDLIGRAGPGQVVREGGETTLLVAAARLDEALERHPRARVEGGLVWVRFELAMGWELVGFLALVTNALAKRGVPIGAVCGFSRDHLFVRESYLDRLEATLRALFPR